MTILNEKLSAKHRAARKDVYGAIQENNEILRKLAKIYYRITGNDLDKKLFKNGNLIDPDINYSNNGILPAKTAIKNFEDTQRVFIKKDEISPFSEATINLSFDTESNLGNTASSAFKYLVEIQPEIRKLNYLKNNTKGSYSYNEIAQVSNENPSVKRQLLAKASQLKDYESTFKKNTIKEEILEIYNKCFNY